MDKITRPPLLYVTFDSIREGVGASQIVPYLKGLSTKFKITLVTFEKHGELMDSYKSLQNNSINWIPLEFGRRGFWGGIGRVFRLSKQISRSDLVHARGDLACLSAVVRGCDALVWDCRALTADQRIEAKGKSKLSFEYIVLRAIELICIKKSSKIIFITQKAQIFMSRRYQIPKHKSQVISTCVDLSLFRNLGTGVPFTKNRELKVLLSGSLGPQYDEERMARFLEFLNATHPVRLGLAIGQESTFQPRFLKVDTVFRMTYAEMPTVINNFDIGLSVWRREMRVSSLSVSAVKNAEILACGKPILVNDNQGDIAEIVAREKVGMAIDFRDDSLFRQTSEHLVELLLDSELQIRCRSVAEKYYDLNLGVSNLEKLYLQVKSNKSD